MKLSDIDLYSWEASIVITAIARPAVPLFFMMSGFLLLHRVNEPWQEHYKKRLPRILIPLVAWSAIYLALRSYKVAFKSWKEVAKILVYSLPSEHLWFLYSMFGFYLVLPILRPMVRLDQRLLLWMVLAWLFTDPFAATLQTFSGQTALGLNLVSFPRIGYFLTGALFKMYATATDRGLVACTVVYAVTFAVMIFGTFHSSIAKGQFFQGYTAQTGVFLALNTIALFPILRYVAQTYVAANAFIHRVALSISDCSYGIYLCHIIFVDFFCSAVSPTAHPGAIRIPVLAIINFLCSYAFVSFLKRVPILRQIVI